MGHASAPAVLVVDDDEAVRRVPADLVASLGYAVFEAIDGQDAWQAQAFELLRIQHTVEQLEEVGDGHELATRHVAEIGPCCQKNRRRKFGQQMIRQIEIEIEASQVASSICRFKTAGLSAFMRAASAANGSLLITGK